MRLLIVDDEPLARERLRRMVEELPGAEVVGEAGDGRAALEACARLHPEVVLLDIRMPGMDGLEAARHLATLPEGPAVIFITAYGDYALQAFEAQAVDYLLKPVRAERLAQALAKARRLTAPQLAAVTAANPEPQGRSHLSSTLHGNLTLIPVEDILFLRAEQKYVVVRHLRGESLIEDSLTALEAEYGPRFVRIHRNALVARSALEGLEKGADGTARVRLRDCEERPEISRRHLPELRRLLRSGEI
ncbi:MAG: DNA-binding response regulator [Gammaproteobacteria bacterium HGW-Gammaproteobacteria-1]|jgi:two-component system response regulator AlgR|nr:MAG: DNA-binding response regulator [Gammaproteobacteria bacterium HGW-Gammaproteobacteria-1]